MRLHLMKSLSCISCLLQWDLNSKYDLTLECENDVKLPYVLFGGEKKQKIHKLIFKGCYRKKSVSSNILITAYSLVHMFAERKLSFRQLSVMLLLSDMLFIKHEACTKANLRTLQDDIVPHH